MYQKNIFLVTIVMLIGLSVSQICYSQGLSKIDSLKKELTLVGGSNRFELLWGLAYELFDVDNPQAFLYSKQAYNVALKGGDSLHIVKSGTTMGQLLRRVDKLDESIQILSSLLPVAERHNFARERKLILNGLAIAYTFKAEYDKALEYHFQSLVIREKEGDKKQISISLFNIGFVYFKLNSFELALDYYLESLAAKEASGDSFDLDRLLINIGLCYNGLADYQNAQKFLNRAFQACNGSCKNQIILEGEYGLGHSSYYQEKYSDAEQHFKKSLALSISENDRRFELENLTELTRIYLKQNNLNGAAQYLSKAEMLVSKVQYKDILLNIYGLNAEFYTKSKDFQRANLFRERYSKLRDSIFATDVIKNLTKVQTQYSQRENLAIIAAKDQVLELKEEVITQQRLLNWLLIFVIVLVGVLGTIIYRNYKRIKVVNEALALAKRIIEDQNRMLDQQVQQKTKELIDSNEALVKVNDELDNFIYKTSHDIRGPLASLKGMVNLARMDVKDDKALGYLGKLDLTAEKLNSILTRLLIVNRINHAELKPEVIHFEPIIQEILTLEMKKGVPQKIKIEYDVAADIQLVSDKEMVRLILENLIDNAVKFYNESVRIESFVKIAVRTEDGKVTAHIMDNGVGIAQMNRENIFQMFVRASERSETGGIGLYLAKLATEKLGGDINLVSTEKYTEFIVDFPQDLQSIIDRRRDEKKKQDLERMQVEISQGTARSEISQS